MFKELKTYNCVCDNCGYEQSNTTYGKPFPAFWGTAELKRYQNTRLEGEKHDLCPECIVQLFAKDPKLSEKYDKSTIRQYTI